MSIEAMKQALEALEFDGFTPEDATHRHYTTKAITALKAALEQPEQGQWDAIPESFNQWWDADYDDSTNPFRLNSPAYWAWAGWSAANEEKNK